MRRFLSLLLVSSLLANQAACVAHTHAGTNVAEPVDHSARPHVHLSGHSHSHGGHSHGGHSHHGHSHSPSSHEPGGADHRHRHAEKRDGLHAALRPVADHDSDAVYFAAHATLYSVRTAKWTPRVDSSIDGWTDAAVTDGVTSGQGPAEPFLDRPPSFDSRLPLYLRTHCLRC